MPGLIDALNGLTNALENLNLGQTTNNGPNPAGTDGEQFSDARETEAPAETADERNRAAEAYTNSLPIRDRLREESWQAYRFANPVVVPACANLTRAQRLAHLDLRPLKIRAQRRRALQDRTHAGDWLSESQLLKTLSEGDYYTRNPLSQEKATRDLGFLRNVVDLHIAGLSDRQLAYLRDIIGRVYDATEKRTFEQFVKDVTGRQL